MSCSTKINNSSPILPSIDSTAILDSAFITVNSLRETGIISPLIMGFNVEYIQSGPDAFWENGAGKIPQQLKKIGTGVLRYPGGTLTTYYHWEHLTGQGNGHIDTWSPDYDSSKDVSASSFMNLDEYLNICKQLNTEPLIGINMSSGIKYNRINEGIEEAKRLMLYCKQKGVKVKYFYLGNEPYQTDANYTYTANEYARMVNLYVPAMKKIDDQIMIIAEGDPWDLSFNKTLVSEAGKNIDYLDLHFYWKWKGTSYATWKSETIMGQGVGGSYKSQRQFYRNLFTSLGYPNIDLVSLEWNIGSPGNRNQQVSQAESALMVAEQFMQFIQSGMPIATFWSVSWPRLPTNYRMLLDADHNFQPNKLFDMFGLYRDIIGQKMIDCQSSDKAIQVLSGKSLNEDTLWIYLINKLPVNLNSNQANPVCKINIDIQNYRIQNCNAVGFDANDKTTGTLKINKLKTIQKNENRVMLMMPPYSFAKMTLTK